VAHSDVGERSLMDVLRRCRELRVKASVLPRLFDVMGPSVEIDDIEGMTMLGIAPPVFPRSSRFLKRTMDVVGAVVTLVAVAPLLAVIAIAIRFDSPGPVLFRQQRIGRGGRPFSLLKFRTMVADAEERRAALLSQSSDPHWLHLEHDPRVTRVGRLLRLSSLDEIPQLWNVLKGEMSLVGPRPEDPAFVNSRRFEYSPILALKPGMTGLTQLAFAKEGEIVDVEDPVADYVARLLPQKIALDTLYAGTRSLSMDLRVLAWTALAVLLRRDVAVHRHTGRLSVRRPRARAFSATVAASELRGDA
jgi:lipopolysaccharide/colanic/teichoic acid biosynthesis glycosyltransferase